MVQRTVKGDAGLEVLTPMYTGVDKAGKLQGLLINRGRIPYEYKDSNMHHTPKGEKSDIEGVLFYSEGSGEKDEGIRKQVEEKKRQREGLIRINVRDLVKNTELSMLPENDVANKVYVKVVDLELN